MSDNRVIVELEKGVWLTDGQGDPPRTLRKGKAKRYMSRSQAKRALHNARQWRDFDNAEIEVVEPQTEDTA